MTMLPHPPLFGLRGLATAALSAFTWYNAASNAPLDPRARSRPAHQRVQSWTDQSSRVTRDPDTFACGIRKTPHAAPTPDEPSPVARAPEALCGHGVVDVLGRAVGRGTV
eukprot:5135730-Prymnesium_polylepis.1